MVNVDDLKIAMRAAIDPAGLMQRVADQTELERVLHPDEAGRVVG